VGGIESWRLRSLTFRAACGCALVGVIAACSGGNDESASRATVALQATSPETTIGESTTTVPITTTTSPVHTSTQPSNTAPATTLHTTTAPPEPVNAEPPPSQQTLVELVQFVATQNWSGGVLAQTDQACFDFEIARNSAAVREAAAQIADPANDPFLWYDLDDNVRKAIVGNYIDCMEGLDLARHMIALGTINTPEPGCVVDAWGTAVDRRFIVSSLAVGLQELPQDVLDELTAGVLTCLADEEWWIQDVALELEGDDYTLAEAACVAETLIAQFGVEPLIRRRLLTIPILSLPPDQLTAVEAGTCGVELALPIWDGRTAVGNCIDHFFAEEGEWSAVQCNQVHDAEVIAVEDVTERFPTYPGSAELADAVGVLCQRIADSMPPNDEVGMTWAFPSRPTWERGDRTLSCVIGKLDGSSWTGPSGLSAPSST
jgi:hypothetical protein